MIASTSKAYTEWKTSKNITVQGGPADLSAMTTGIKHVLGYLNEVLVELKFQYKYYLGK